MWLDPSDASTAFQDSAGTTPGAIDSPVGKRVSKAGNLSAVLQATATARPVWKSASGIYSDLFDGTDDGYATATFAAGTLTANMDCFYAIKRTSGSVVVPFAGAISSTYFGNCDPGASTANSGTGSNTSFSVDGTPVAGGTAVSSSSLNSAVTPGAWHVVEAKNLNLSSANWTQFFISNFAGGFFRIVGDLGGLILCPAQSDANRAIVRRELGRKVGLSL